MPEALETPEPGEEPVIHTAETIEVSIDTEEIGSEAVDDSMDANITTPVANETVEERVVEPVLHAVVTSEPEIEPVVVTIAENEKDFVVQTPDVAPVALEPEVVVEEAITPDTPKPVTDTVVADHGVEPTDPIRTHHEDIQVPDSAIQTVEMVEEDEMFPIASISEVREETTSFSEDTARVDAPTEHVVEVQDTPTQVEEAEQHVAQSNEGSIRPEGAPSSSNEDAIDTVVGIAHHASGGIERNDQGTMDAANTEETDSIDTTSKETKQDDQSRGPVAEELRFADSENTISLDTDTASKDPVPVVSSADGEVLEGAIMRNEDDTVKKVENITEEATDFHTTDTLEAVLEKPIEVDEADEIHIVQQENSIIISAQPPSTEGEIAASESLDPLPITNVAALESAITVVENLPVQTESAGVNYEDDKTQKKDTDEQEVTIMVSPEIIDLVEAFLNEKEEVLENQESTTETLEVVTTDTAQEIPTLITVQTEAEKVILGGSYEVLPEETEPQEAPSIAPVTTTEELTEAFTYIHALTVDAKTANVGEDVGKTDTIQDETPPQQVEVIMSEEMLELIETVKETVSEQMLKETTEKEVTQPEIIFSTDGEEKKQVVLTSEEFQAIRQFLMENIVPNANHAQEDTNSALQPVELDNDEIFSTSETEGEVKPIISELAIATPENSITLFEMKKAPKEGKKKEQVMKKRHVVLSSGDQEITIDLETLNEIVKIAKMNKRVHDHIVFAKNEQAPEEVKPNYASFQRGNTLPSTMSYQVLLYLLAVTDRKVAKYEFALSNQSVLQAA